MTLPDAPVDSTGSGEAPGKPLLSVRNLSSGYGDTQVLWDISLEVFPDEVVALVGSNGAGKTTLLATISHLVPAWSGDITFMGQPIARSPAERIVQRGLVHVPQGRRLFQGLTVEQNLLMGAYTRRGEGGSRSADLERMYTFLPRLGERRTQMAGSLSGGEQQMCAIARGLMARPQVLMIDELSLGLAPNLVDDILTALDAIHREERIGILLVEQDVQIALERAGRGYVIESGHIVMSGPAQELMGSSTIRTAYLGEL